MLPKRYNPNTIEPELQSCWYESGTYRFDPNSTAPVYSIDTPPPTVSGKLHLGHTFSYSHPDFIARFWRMNGHNVFYPMGFDDNGLPTGKLVETKLGVKASELGREAFITACQKISKKAEQEYQELWQRLGLSIDWTYTYRTIDDDARAIAQLSFLKMFRKGMAYRKEAPTIWCSECGTAIAQAELNDKVQHVDFITINFRLLQTVSKGESGVGLIPIATTRPELLPACVAVFIHPDDHRYLNFLGKRVQVPLFEQEVSIYADPKVDPEKGTGVVMCCTFGDQTDVAWWQNYDLPLVQVIGQNGHMTGQAGSCEGLPIQTARDQIIEELKARNFWETSEVISHEVRIHERCDTPVEYISTHQWFISVLDIKDDLIEAGDKVNWFPPHMKSRYQAWVENLSWDWCISRQRFFGVPFPVWYCQGCGEPQLADEFQLPIDPHTTQPSKPCSKCGERSFTPEMDVMDTWATSSLSPQIVGKWLRNPQLYGMVYPFSLRAQAHEIIRTWAFYTIVKSNFHFNTVPWANTLISGWGISGEGLGKISKSRGGGPMPPMEMIEKYSADAIRYWAGCTGPGKDSIISEDKIQIGNKLVNKIWNVARFCSQFIQEFDHGPDTPIPNLSPADQWILSRTQKLVQRVTLLFEKYEYAAAIAETEVFFWQFADNYLEMAKQRLYETGNLLRTGAQFTLYHVLLTLLKLFAPILPHITESIYQGIFTRSNKEPLRLSLLSSIHTSDWPAPNPKLINDNAEIMGDILVNIATHIRRFKSENSISLGTEISRVQLAAGDPDTAMVLGDSIPDLKSITRAIQIEIQTSFTTPGESIQVTDSIQMKLDP